MNMQKYFLNILWEFTRGAEEGRDLKRILKSIQDL